jgi:galactokinase
LIEPRTATARGPGRVNLIGEHTDYNGGLALPFPIALGCTVQATAIEGGEMVALARDLDEDDRFPLRDVRRAEGWRAFVRGTVAELAAAGFEVRPAQLTMVGDVPRGRGLSSSAALEVALALALLALSGQADAADRVQLARLCSRVENDWVGARTGLLDQLAALVGEPGHALRMDFATLDLRPVPLRLRGWRLVVLDSGAARRLASADGYNARRAECERPLRSSACAR